MVAVRGLTRRFGGMAAVDGLDLDVAPGSRHAVVGPNGAGKTTLLDLVAGEIRPSAGTVLIDGADLTRASRARRARLGVARTFQQPAVFGSLTALDNVAIAAWRAGSGRGRWRRGPYRRLAEECRPHLAAAGLAGSGHRVAGTLAHGERRMLDLAMALAARPRLLLLDEPAAGLTDEGLEDLLTALDALPREVTVIVVEHDFAFVTAVADTVTVLRDGRRLATGSPAAIAADPAVRHAYLGGAEETP
jgi:branched-chain amino acid transport system ATP-binding protein